MSLTPEQLQSVINEIVSKKFIKYDIDRKQLYRFRFAHFNFVRPGNPLEIPKYDIPLVHGAICTSTPAELNIKNFLQ